jgi:hypothetical protein
VTTAGEDDQQQQVGWAAQVGPSGQGRAGQVRSGQVRPPDRLCERPGVFASGAPGTAVAIMVHLQGWGGWGVGGGASAVSRLALQLLSAGRAGGDDMAGVTSDTPVSLTHQDGGITAAAAAQQACWQLVVVCWNSGVGCGGGGGDLCGDLCLLWQIYGRFFCGSF